MFHIVGSGGKIVAGLHLSHHCQFTIALDPHLPFVPALPVVGLQPTTGLAQ